MNRLLLAFSIGLMLSVSLQAQDDQVLIEGGRSLKGSIVGSTVSQLAINIQGNTRTIDVIDIRRVSYGGEPEDLSIGRARALGGKTALALGSLRNVDEAQIESEMVRLDLEYYVAFCEGKLALTAGGDKAKATEGLLDFVKKAPNHYHFFEAAELLGDLAVSQEKYEDAVRYYGSIATKAPFPSFKMRGLIAEARALLAQDLHAEAEPKFREATGIESDTSEAKRQKLMAQLGMAICLSETKTPEEGIKLVETIIAENDPSDSELFGRAYNAHGDCLQKAGKPKEAMMAYLHVDVLFYAHPEIHAESLYHLSKLWAEAKQPDRASAARRLLDERYAGSVWSKKP